MDRDKTLSSSKRRTDLQNHELCEACFGQVDMLKLLVMLEKVSQIVYNSLAEFRKPSLFFEP